MVCPRCQGKTQIYNSRSNKRTLQTWRRHRCQSCGFVFSTREIIEADQALQIVQGETRESFSRARLLLSLAQACSHRSDDAEAAFYLANVVETKLFSLSAQGIISKQQIITTTLTALKNYDTKAYLKYLGSREELIDERDLKEILK